MVPYLRGVSEEIHRTMKAYNIPVFFKPINTLRQLLVRPKDPLPKERVCGPIYHIPCDNCDASYVGESERSLKARFSEHRRPSSVTSEVSRHLHVDQPGHTIDMEQAKILTVDNRWFERGVNEAILIRTLKPSLNKDGGRFHLVHVWDNLLYKSLGAGATLNRPGNPVMTLC